MSRRFFLPVIIIYFFTSACVSVSIPNSSETKPSKGIDFTSPDHPFYGIDVPPADKAWISQKTGNTISFLSDCRKNSDPTLEQMQRESFSVLDEPEPLQTEKISFNSRDALLSKTTGKVDGVFVGMNVLVFKKNGCSYTLTYAGLKNRLPSELQQFQSFMNGFRAP